MKQFRIVPTIYQMEDCKEFVRELQVGEGDLILTREVFYHKYFAAIAEGATYLYMKNYGEGEPTDVLVEAILNDIKELSFKRVIAIGGGSIIDVSKLLVQETASPVLDLFDKKIPTKKVKELVIVPTTCGTGSEVTSVSVIELVSRRTKIGLQTDEEFADAAVIIPELLDNLPFEVFATSSVDALIHACESFLSPRANEFTEMFSKEAIRIILAGYRRIVEEGREVTTQLMKEFVLASTYAGIAFGNAGCAAVHALSMVFGGAYHVAHGEANYTLFTSVFKAYQKLKPVGKIQVINKLFSECLGCSQDEVYEYMEKLLSQILSNKSPSEYGVTKDAIISMTKTVIEKQGRLMANNYTELDSESVLEIYESVFLC